MRRTGKELIWASRAMAAIGLMSLSLSGEIGPAWVIAGWASWMLGWILDRFPESQAGVRKMETVAVIALVSFTLVDFFVIHSSVFITVAHFVLLFAMFKSWGPKERKDCSQIGIIGFFQLLAACTLSADIAQAILLIALIPAGTALLYWGQVERVKEESKASSVWPAAALTRLYGIITAVTLPIILGMTAVMFTVFPRLNFNLQIPGFGNDQTAYTEQVNLDRTGAIGEDSSPAAWVRFGNDSDRAAWGGYLRGEIMDEFNGKRWVHSAQKADPVRWTPDQNNVIQVNRARNGEPTMRHTITLLSTEQNTLLMPGDPVRIIVAYPLQQSEAGSWRTVAPLSKPLQYEVAVLRSENSYSAATPDESTLQKHRALPAMAWGRISTLAGEIAGQGSDLDKARRLETYLRTNFRYSLINSAVAADHPIEDFLLNRRSGSCGHFSSALAVMLRLQGIACRLVAGYHGGEWNEPAQQILLRNKDAHAWVEAWIDNRWLRLDPTPLPEEGATSGNRWARLGLRARQYWDYAAYLWGRFVVEYDIRSQWKALAKAGDKASQMGYSFDGNFSVRPKDKRAPLSIKTIVTPIIVGVLFLAAIILVRSVWRQARTHQRSPVPSAYLRFLKQMERDGLPRQPWETPHEFAQRARTRFPDRASMINTATASYISVRYEATRQ